MSELLDLEKYSDVINTIHLTKDSGKVTEVKGMLIKGYLPGASVGSIVQINPSGTERYFLAEVVGFNNLSIILVADKSNRT